MSNGEIIVTKDGDHWDTAKFDPDNPATMTAAMQDAVDWEAKILREDPTARVGIEVRTNRPSPDGSLADRLRNPEDALIWACLKASAAAPNRRDAGFSAMKAALAAAVQYVEDCGP